MRNPWLWLCVHYDSQGLFALYAAASFLIRHATLPDPVQFVPKTQVECCNTSGRFIGLGALSWHYCLDNSTFLGCRSSKLSCYIASPSELF